MLYLHGVGVVHRDLTPKNVLLDKEGAKIADFGVSRLNDIDYITHPVGALPYVAPEVYLQHRYSAAADVYSFAVILWEMLTGHDACGSLKPRELADAVAHQRFRPPLPPVAGWIEGPLLSLVERAWDASPEARPTFLVLLHSMENMASDAADAGYVLERDEM
jgi:serine/threonine protein kinase